MRSGPPPLTNLGLAAYHSGYFSPNLPLIFRQSSANLPPIFMQSRGAHCTVTGVVTQPPGGPATAFGRWGSYHQLALVTIPWCNETSPTPGRQEDTACLL
jgi:hypothetical protein